MRTTVTLDPDVEALLHTAMRDKGASFKHVLNDALRRGLVAPAATPPPPFVQITFDCGRPLVDLTKAGALADELDDLALAAKLLQKGLTSRVDARCQRAAGRAAGASAS